MNRTISIAPVRKTIVVQATPETAFAVFTAGLDRWWPKTHNIGSAPIRESIIEPFVGGRWYSKCEDGSEAVVGHVSVWQPAVRFVVSWEISAQWKPDARVALASEVEVRFVADAAGGTRVELEHRNFERMGMPDGETMRKGVDGGWPGLLELFAKEVSAGDGGFGKSVHGQTTIAQCVDYLRVDMSQFDMRRRKRMRFRGNFRPYHHREIRGIPFRLSYQVFQTFLK